MLCFQREKPKETHITSSHQHDHNIQHNHAYIYSKVYTCTHYDHKGHLAKFCYAKLKMMNKNVWAEKVLT